MAEMVENSVAEGVYVKHILVASSVCGGKENERLMKNPMERALNTRRWHKCHKLTQIFSTFYFLVASSFLSLDKNFRVKENHRQTPPTTATHKIVYIHRFTMDLYTYIHRDLWL